MHRRRAFAALILILMFASASVAGARQLPPGNQGPPGTSGPPGQTGQQGAPGGGPPVDWTPERLVVEGNPGLVHSATVEFEISGGFNDIDVRIVPELAGIVVPETNYFNSLEPDISHEIELTIAIPNDATPNTSLDGTLQLRDGNRTLARPLPIEVVVTDVDAILHTLTMETPIGDGTVEPEEGAHTYPEGTDVELEAFPDQGWGFGHWIINGEPDTDAPSTTITVDGDISVQAVFEEIPVVQTLEPGASFTGVDGVTIGAPEGALDEAVDIEIQRVDDPTGEVPVPDGWDAGGMQIVGNYYSLKSSNDVVPPYGRYLTIGLPVPENLSPADLAIAVLSPPDSVISHGDVDQSMRWHTERGQYDEASGLFGTSVPFVGSEPRIYALVAGAGYGDVELPDEVGNPSLPSLSEQEFSGFQVVCVNNFVNDPCTQEHQQQTEAALNAAYVAWVEELGFNQPRLQHTLVGIEFPPGEAPMIELVYTYDYLLSYNDTVNGAYAIEEGIGVTFYPADDAHPDPDDLITRHELFHALQYGYPATFENREAALQGVVEGTATAAEMSLDRLTRSSRDGFPGREPRRVDIGLLRDLASADVHAYATQDFWVYLGRRINPGDPQLSYLIPLFEQGSQPADLELMLQKDSPFSSLADAYWQWVRNQGFEKTQPLGSDGAGNSIPASAQCSWSGHGAVELFSLSPDLSSFGMSFDLEPLSSVVFDVTLQAGVDPRTVLTAIDASSAGHDGVQVKFYLEEDVGTDACVSRSEDDSHSVTVSGVDQSFHVLVANTDTTSMAADIELKFKVVEDLIIRAPDGREIADFGHSIAVSGEKILIGAPRHGGVALEPIWGTGQAYLFEADGTHLTTFVAPDAQERSHFGHSVAGFGEKMLIGAPAYDTSAGDQAGQVYLFDAGGTYLQTLSAPDGQEFARFGSAIATVGEVIAISADSHDTGDGIFAGQVYLFDADGIHLHTLSLPDGTFSSGFGRSLAAVGDKLLIGTSLGRAYLFDTEGNHVHTFEDPESTQLSSFGVTVEGIGENVLIGAPAAQHTLGFNAGRVYLYDVNGNLLQSFTAPDAQSGADFGRSIAAAGEIVIVGAPGHNTDAGLQAGQAYLFSAGGTHLHTFVAPDSQRLAQFGGAVAVADDSVVIGARNQNTDAGESAGQVYLFALSGLSIQE